LIATKPEDLSLLSLVQCFKESKKPTQIEHHSGASVHTKRLDCKSLAGTNTLAYLPTASVRNRTVWNVATRWSTNQSNNTCLFRTLNGKEK